MRGLIIFLFLFFHEPLWSREPSKAPQSPEKKTEPKPAEVLTVTAPGGSATTKVEKLQNKQEKTDERRKTPLVEDPKLDVEGKKIEEGLKPAPKTPEKGGHTLLSFAGIYTFNLHGVHNEKSDGEFNALAALIEIGANDNIAFETGFILAERQYQVVNDNYFLQQNVTRLHIPVNLKLWWKDIVAFGLGPYVAFAMSGTDNYKVIRIAETGDLETPAEDFSEFGFEVTLALNAPFNDKTGFFVEARYFVPYDTVHMHKTNSIYGLVGFKYQLGDN